VRYSPLDTARVDESSPGECFLSATTSADETGAVDVLAAGAVAASSCSSGGLAACSSSTCSSTGSAAVAATTPTGNVGSTPAAAAGVPRGYGRSASGGSANAGNDSELDSNEGSSGDSSDTSAASFSGMMEDVLRDAFIKTDEEFSDSGLQAGLVGSTAVVALVGTHRVWIANCGESQPTPLPARTPRPCYDCHEWHQRCLPTLTLCCFCLACCWGLQTVYFVVKQAWWHAVTGLAWPDLNCCA
jgi:hypothetical protein